MLEFKHQVYRQNSVLFSIDSLQIEFGKLVILFGANGTGKSTWLRSIVRPNETQNNYNINGKSASELSNLELAKTVAFVDNHFMGLDHLTVEEFISLGRYPYTGISGRLSEEDKAIISKVVDQLHLTHLLGKSTSELSDGERQRCGIAKALIQETAVILLDEPTSFLDYPSKKELFELLEKICQTENKLVIVSTHDIDLGLEHGSLWCIIDPKQQFVVTDKRLSKTELLELSF